MLKVKRFCIGLLVLSSTFLLLNISGVAVAQDDQCVFPTFTHDLTYSQNWNGSTLVIHMSNDEVTESEPVEVWVESESWGCPPYNWEVSGDKFSFDSTDPEAKGAVTYSDFEELTIYAHSGACGTATITVTDSCDGDDTAYARSDSGYWAWNLAWRAGLNRTTCGGEGDCGNSKTVSYIIGKNKWEYSTWDIYHRLRDVAKYSTCTFGDSWGYPDYSPSDGPFKTPLDGTSWSSCDPVNRPYAAWARVNIYEWQCQ